MIKPGTLTSRGKKEKKKTKSGRSRDRRGSPSLLSPQASQRFDDISQPPTPSFFFPILFYTSVLPLGLYSLRGSASSHNKRTDYVFEPSSRKLTTIVSYPHGTAEIVDGVKVGRARYGFAPGCLKPHVPGLVSQSPSKAVAISVRISRLVTAECRPEIRRSQP